MQTKKEKEFSLSIQPALTFEDMSMLKSYANVKMADQRAASTHLLLRNLFWSKQVVIHLLKGVHYKVDGPYPVQQAQWTMQTDEQSLDQTQLPALVGLICTGFIQLLLQRWQSFLDIGTGHPQFAGREARSCCI